jgi:hypothetical protein
MKQSDTRWKCGETQKELLCPVSRRAVYSSCNSELHVCRMCRFYNPWISDQCAPSIHGKRNASTFAIILTIVPTPMNPVTKSNSGQRSTGSNNFLGAVIQRRVDLPQNPRRIGTSCFPRPRSQTRIAEPLFENPRPGAQLSH